MAKKPQYTDEDLNDHHRRLGQSKRDLAKLINPSSQNPEQPDPSLWDMPHEAKELLKHTDSAWVTFTTAPLHEWHNYKDARRRGRRGQQARHGRRNEELVRRAIDSRKKNIHQSVRQLAKKVDADIQQEFRQLKRKRNADMKTGMSEKEEQLLEDCAGIKFDQIYRILRNNKNRIIGSR